MNRENVGPLKLRILRSIKKKSYCTKETWLIGGAFVCGSGELLIDDWPIGLRKLRPLRLNFMENHPTVLLLLNSNSIFCHWRLRPVLFENQTFQARNSQCLPPPPLSLHPKRGQGPRPLESNPQKSHQRRPPSQMQLKAMSTTISFGHTPRSRTGRGVWQSLKPTLK
jgi:hypothetical protein